MGVIKTATKMVREFRIAWAGKVNLPDQSFQVPNTIWVGDVQWIGV